MIVEQVPRSVYQKIDALLVVVQVVMQNCLKYMLSLYLWCGTKRELVESCVVINSDRSSKSLDREVDGFLKGFQWKIYFDVVLMLDTDGSCNEGTGG